MRKIFATWVCRCTGMQGAVRTEVLQTTDDLEEGTLSPTFLFFLSGYRSYDLHHWKTALSCTINISQSPSNVKSHPFHLLTFPFDFLRSRSYSVPPRMVSFPPQTMSFLFERSISSGDIPPRTISLLPWCTSHWKWLVFLPTGHQRRHNNQERIHISKMDLGSARCFLGAVKNSFAD